MEKVGALAAAAGLALLLSAVGRRILGALGSREERAALGLPVGLGLLALGVEGSLFWRLPLGAVLGLAGAAALALSWREAREATADLGAFLLRAGPERIGVAVVLIQLGLGLIGALAPPTGWDSGVYHFTLAKLRASEGWMVVRDDIPHSWRPMTMECLHAAGFLLQGETLASLFNFLAYLSGFGVSRLWGGRLGGDPGRLFGGLAWLACGTFALRMDGGDVEVGQAVCFGAALYALDRLRDDDRAGWRLLAGASLGVLLGMKYASAWLLVAVAAAWTVVRLRDRAPWGLWLRDAGGIVLPGILLGSPWYVRNAVQTGQIFFPYGSDGEALSGGGLEAEASVGRALLQSLGLDAIVGTALFALVAGAGGRSRWIAAAGGFSLLLLVRQMGLTTPGVANAFRYASPAWTAFLPLAAAWAATTMGKGGRSRKAVVGVFALALAASSGLVAARNLRKVPAALELVSRDAYLAERVNFLPLLRVAEAALPEGGKILLVDQRSYYVEKPFLTWTDLHRKPDLDAVATAAEFRALLDRQGVRVVVANRAPGMRTWAFRRLADRLERDFASAGIETVETRNEVTLYLVR